MDSVEEWEQIVARLALVVHELAKRLIALEERIYGQDNQTSQHPCSTLLGG